MRKADKLMESGDLSAAAASTIDRYEESKARSIAVDSQAAWALGVPGFCAHMGLIWMRGAHNGVSHLVSVARVNECYAKPCRTCSILLGIGDQQKFQLHQGIYPKRHREEA